MKDQFIINDVELGKLDLSDPQAIEAVMVKFNKAQKEKGSKDTNEPAN